MAHSKSALLLFITLISQTSAWGTLGHTTVAFIAQNFVCNRTASFAQKILNDTSDNYLANVATWADSYRSQPGGEFSAPLHYIDALDAPPESCDVDFERDCPEEGCIVSAIANYTERVNSRDVSLEERQKALKWIIHFVGDIHQPLHVENLEVGGNLINVTFEGKSANLHRIWDSNMPEKLIGGYALEDAREWAASLTSEIATGKYANATKSWLKGIDIKDSIESAMVWARDANSHVCDTVVPEGAEGVRNQELEGAYYDKSIPVIQMQIAKAGFRLAAWLDLIVTGNVEGGNATGESKGKGKGKGGKDKFEKRNEFELEEWMVEARRVRRAFGWGCRAEGHHH